MAQYLPSIIEAIGGILGSTIAAFIAAGYVSKIFKRNIDPLFLTYSSKNHDASKIFRKAKKNIYIVASIGDQLLKAQESRIREHLKRSKANCSSEEKLKIFFLIQGKEQYFELEHYINAQNDFTDEYYDNLRTDTLKKLKKLEEDFPNQVEIREFHSFLPASYIGIDIENTPPNIEIPTDAVIQVMLYQYGVEAKMCPLTYFSFKKNQDLFRSTSQCILNMWDHSLPI